MLNTGYSVLIIGVVFASLTILIWGVTHPKGEDEMSPVKNAGKVLTIGILIIIALTIVYAFFHKSDADSVVPLISIGAVFVVIGVIWIKKSTSNK